MDATGTRHPAADQAIEFESRRLQAARAERALRLIASLAPDFDEYKAETLKRLEEEQREFKEFLRRLRMSKDRAEFDQFMNERRNAGGGRAPEPQT